MIDLSRDIPVEHRRKSFVPQSRTKLGISGFRTPVTLETMAGVRLTLPADVEVLTTVSDGHGPELTAFLQSKVREYLHDNSSLDSDRTMALLSDLRKCLASDDVYIKYEFSYPLTAQDGLVTYYDCTLESRSTDKLLRCYLTVVVSYVSALPGTATVVINYDPGNTIFPEELVLAMNAVLDQELASSVDQAATHLADMLDGYARVRDYVVQCELMAGDTRLARTLAVTRKGIAGGLR